MAIIVPFQCIHPAPEYAAQVAALPYDVYNRKEAAKETANHPLSFLNIDRPETQFPLDADMYAPQVYEKANELLAVVAAARCAGKRGGARLCLI